MRRCGLLLPTEWRGLSVGLSVCHTSKPCKNGWTNRDAVWVVGSDGQQKSCVRWGARSPLGRGNFKGEWGRPIVKWHSPMMWKNSWTDWFAVWVVDLSGPKEAQVQSYSPGGTNVPHGRVHCWTWLNRPSAVAMQPYVKLLWPLVTFQNSGLLLAMVSHHSNCWALFIFLKD